MNKLYSYLLEGHTKVEALQLAQKDLMGGSQGAPALHPYYWAPFFLIGDPGAI
jgi:CHAT domain-containing protein